ncbi:myosin heavy chain IB-like [Vigna radiata var. radiata]|uniref:Myosin heavy chain IB-like n=1 Tax=Vigna radiata var. radiata TaxID=3916 RepID=A0A3Q0ESH7_VIGRR|nr:myosin heavy chain IB-like [Vigna radiata var. radiata]
MGPGGPGSPGPGGPGWGPGPGGPGWGPGPGGPGWGPGPGGPGWGPGGPGFFGPGGFFGGCADGICGLLSSCFYCLCCCCLFRDCFSGRHGPGQGMPPPPF